MTKILSDKLLVSEDFYSVQGEGKTSGVPSFFIRLSQCDLTCGSSIKYINQIKKGEVEVDLNQPFIGDLEGGAATWSCDTTPVWLRGNYVEFGELVAKWKAEGIYDDICDGTIHIIWTGGEPTIKQHQQAIVNFNKFLAIDRHGSIGYEHAAEYYGKTLDTYAFSLQGPFQEIETNGRNYIIDELFSILNQINCSPKLSNSGMSVKQRIVPESIERIMEHRNYQFKFVISTEDDIFEMFDTYIRPFDIPLKNVVCMPALTEQENFFERTRWCMEMGKKYKFTALTRLHVASWNSLTGV